MVHKIGTIFISLGIVAAGISKLRTSKIKHSNQLVFLRLLGHIKNEISANNRSVYSALMTFDDKHYRKTDFFRAVSEKGMSEIVVFFEKNGDMLFGNSQVKTILSDFFSEIYYCRTATECRKTCEKHITNLEKTISENENQHNNQIQLEKTLCFLAAAAIFVILI